MSALLPCGCEIPARSTIVVLAHNDTCPKHRALTVAFLTQTIPLAVRRLAREAGAIEESEMCPESQAGPPPLQKSPQKEM